MRDLPNSDAQLKINHLPVFFVPKLLFCRLCSGVLQEALMVVIYIRTMLFVVSGAFIVQKKSAS
jgi:hypothetical protein